MTQATKPRHSRQARLSVAWETAAECQLQLTPFPGCPDGWAGSISQFLAHIRDGTFLLECVPLVPVIDQYVTHIKGLSLDRAGEFLDLAASLIHWKSRLILPVDPLLTGADGDPREEIMRDLREGEQRRRGRRTAPASKTEQNHATEGAAELSLLDLFILLNDVERNGLPMTDQMATALTPFFCSIHPVRPGSVCSWRCWRWSKAANSLWTKQKHSAPSPSVRSRYKLLSS
jgi:hypothetical protein